MGGSGVVRLHSSLVLFLVFVNFCLTKKRKKKKKLLPFVKVFSLANEVFFWFSRKFFTRNSSQKLLFAKVFVKNFAIFWSRESFCSWKFLPLKYSYWQQKSMLNKRTSSLFKTPTNQISFLGLYFHSHHSSSTNLSRTPVQKHTFTQHHLVKDKVAL